MMPLIPILDTHVYSIAVLTTWCLGSSCIATHIYMRWFMHTSVQPLFIQLVIKGIICIAGATLISFCSLLAGAVWLQVVGMMFGLLAGQGMVQLELFLSRYHLRQQLVTQVTSSINIIRPFYHIPSNKMLTLALQPIRGNKTQLKNIQEQYAAHELNNKNYSLSIILLIAICEEILFRGYLVKLCWLLPPFFCDLALAGTIMLFGISHVNGGGYQILAKMFLGAVCMFAVLLFDSIIPAIITHAYFNFVAYCKQKKYCVS